MKKAFDQTVRELKREVNKKVLKVPGIEQKILDATSNELWGPHGSLLADIAQATRNYHEYQIIMHVIWKRLNDTGKNWRHVYKSLTVLEYLVGHGSERVIDEIKEHAYQISTLSDFQYIDSSGKDQGNNVRRKAQSLVSLINDKEKIQEVRQKALTNKDKYRSTFSQGGSHKPGYVDRYDDDRYEGRFGNRDDDRNGYGREKDLGYRDDDRYAKGGEFYRDSDGYSRDSDEHSGRGSYKHDDNRGGRDNDDYQLGSRNNKDRDHSYEEDDSYSYRNGTGRANDASPDERNLERKLSEQSVNAPPNYESVVRNDNNNIQDERDGAVGTAVDSTTLPSAAPKAFTSLNQQHSVAGAHLSPMNMDDTSFDEFDPRGFTPAVNSDPLAATNYAQPAAFGSVVDLFGSSSLDPVDSLALVLAAPATLANETENVTTNSSFGMNFVALSSTVALSQPIEDPFGDAPFKAISHDHFPNQQQDTVPAASVAFPPSAILMPTSEPVSTVGPTPETAPLDFGFGDSLGGGLTYMPTSELPVAHPNLDALTAHLGQSNLQATNSYYSHTSFPMPGLAVVPPHAAQAFAPTNAQTADMGFLPQPSTAQTVQPPAQANVPPVAQRSTTNKQSNDSFETKSSVWADTLNRGIVNLNISGVKTNPLADIGVDFDSINRLERRKEKEKSSAPMTSSVTMGKAMGSGSGIGRPGSGLINQTRPAGMGIGAYGGTTNQAMGMNMGMGMGMGMNMGMGMGMVQGGPIRPLPEMQSPPPVFPGSGYYNSAGMGGYGSHQPYGGGYR